MIVTMEVLEEGKWCPEARVKMESIRDLPGNRINDFKNKSLKAGSVVAVRCIGPECMAWRWKEHNISGYCGAYGIPKCNEVEKLPDPEPAEEAAE